MLKMKFRMSSKTKFAEIVTENVRMDSETEGETLPETAKPSQIQPGLPLYHFLP